MVEKATSAGKKGDNGRKEAAGEGEAMREEMRMRLLCRMLDVEDCGRVRLSDLLAVLQRSTALSAPQQASYAEQLSQWGSDAAPQTEATAAPAVDAADGGGEAPPLTALGPSVSFEALIERLVADPLLYSALLDSLFAPLPMSEVAPAKAEAAEAVVEVEAKGWRKRIREGMGQVRRRFV